MAHHRKRRRPSTVMMAGAAAAALTLGLVANAGAVPLPPVETIIGVGGASNPTGDRIPDKFEGALNPVHGRRLVLVQYPAELPVDPSVAEGVPVLRAAVDDELDGNNRVLIVGYSEGSLVAEQYKRKLVAETNPGVGEIQFLFLASPFVPNGGIYARFPEFAIPGFVSTGPAAASPYDEMFVSMEYDLVADFPAYANPLSLANAALGFYYRHGDQGPDNVDLDTAPQSVLVTHENGTDTYVLIRAEHLPLLQPLRDVSTALQTTAITEPLLGAIEPTLRLAVDMGYTSRDYRNIATNPNADYQDAATPTRFSLITPPQRIIETIEALPDAIRDGARNLTGGSPSTNSGSTERTTAATANPDATPGKRAPAPRRDPVRKAASGRAGDVEHGAKARPNKPKPAAKSKHQRAAHRAA